MFDTSDYAYFKSNIRNKNKRDKTRSGMNEKRDWMI